LANEGIILRGTFNFVQGPKFFLNDVTFAAS